MRFMIVFIFLIFPISIAFSAVFHKIHDLLPLFLLCISLFIESRVPATLWCKCNLS